MHLSTTYAPHARSVQLTAGGVSIVIDLPQSRLPAIVHWGAVLPELDAAGAAGLIAASVPVAASNTPDVPPRPAIIPEHHSGWTGRPGLSGSFGGRLWSPRFRTVRADLDGVVVEGHMSAAHGTLRVEAIDDNGLLRLILTLELTEHGLLRARAAVENLSAEPYGLEDLTLAFPVPREASELLDFAGQHNNERVPERRPLRTGIHLRENRKGRTGHDSAYLLHAGTPGFGFGRGEVWAVHTAWSGNHRHYAERVPTGEQLIGGGEVLLPGEVRLAPHESYETPWVYGSFGAGLDEVARRFHRHLRSRTPRVSTERPVTFNVWEAVYFRHDLDQLIDLAERAAAIGAERFVLDDGWFGSRRDDTSGLGDWTVSDEAWPDGLHPLVKHVRALGMQFGLWFEPEMVNLDSDVARAHPEWIMASGQELPIEARHQQVLNLSVPGAYAHVRNQILAILHEYPIEYIKWDHNRDLIEAGDRTNAGRAAVRAQTKAFYRLLDEIRAAHPGVEIESCASGGGRVDLRVLEHADRVWSSDNIDPHDRQSILRWTTQLLPPEYMGSHIGSPRSHTTGRRHDLAFRAGTAVFGHLGVEWDITQATPEEMTELREWIDFYKSQRHLLLDGDVVRMDDAVDHIFVHGIVSRDRSRAVFAMAATDTMYPDPATRMKLRGLDHDARYHLRPVIIGSSPSGLVPPLWWGQATQSGNTFDGRTLNEHRRRSVELPGAVFTGAVLERAGVTSPRLHPDQVVLFRADRLD
ncbi:alpha-galactosidase [Nonomuraea sp. NPDC059194]|uniref:alpha-galactosidase n=1 Tax=Nonomuraea sp. NPDC059194 TaxID=3346764 RepID=UPI0036771E41